MYSFLTVFSCATGLEQASAAAESEDLLPHIVMPSPARVGGATGKLGEAVWPLRDERPCNLRVAEPQFCSAEDVRAGEQQQQIAHAAASPTPFVFASAVAAAPSCALAPAVAASASAASCDPLGPAAAAALSVAAATAAHPASVPAAVSILGAAATVQVQPILQLSTAPPSLQGASLPIAQPARPQGVYFPPP